MRDSGKWSRQGQTARELDIAAKEAAIKGINLRDALEFYGMRFNMKGEALCPFHKEKTPSFRIKGRFWHCFGCNESGELIKFVRQKFGLNYLAALDAICKDFNFNPSTPTLADLERLDQIRLERYNAIRRYQALLQSLDIQTKLYWLAYDAVEYSAQFYGGKSIENERYVSAQYALNAAYKALEQAQFDCTQYVRENPSVLQKAATNQSKPRKTYLPPAPKYGELQKCAE